MMPAKDDTRTNRDKQRHHKIGDPGENVDWELRCIFLTQRDAERAKETMKMKAALKAAQKMACEERRLRLEAEKNARKFHALLLQERIRKL